MTKPLTRLEQFDRESLSVDVPEKIDGKWTSVISWKEAPLYIQTPRVAVQSNQDDRIAFLPTDDVRSLLRSVETRVLDLIAQRSAEFFNRQTPFSLQHVTDRHSSVLGEDKTVCAGIEAGAAVRNQYGAAKSVEDLQPGAEASLLVHVHGVRYGKNSTQLLLTLLQAKVYMDPRPQNWQMEETIAVPDPEPVDDISEEINGAQVVDDKYFDSD